MVWEAIFLLLILKIPIIYLCGVVWYAIRAEPRPEEGAAVTARIGEPEPPWAWPRRLLARRRPRGGPHGRPARTYQRRAAAAAATRVEAKR